MSNFESYHCQITINTKKHMKTDKIADGISGRISDKIE